MAKQKRSAKPKASRPYMPGYGISDANSGKGLLDWSWATERLVKAHNYWLATTRPDGRPHCMPVWGIWLEDAFYFSTGRQSRKARNLAVNPNCVISTEVADGAKINDAIIVEGSVKEITDQALRLKFADLYSAKYRWDMEGFAEPVYLVRPVVAFAFIEGADEFTGTATRWAFDD
ncbi:MAG TPA: pyridoxamine 5'-phosphate oxidase family protein [Blastocatellia bacterium]|nr:pyridoxamine 5'-phosphate oxidase family protein [Blastocatellia bacterium]